MSKASSEKHIFASSRTDTGSNSIVCLNEGLALLICSFVSPSPSASYLVLFNKLKDESLVKGFIGSRYAQRVFPGLKRLRFDEIQGIFSIKPPKKIVNEANAGTAPPSKRLKTYAEGGVRGAKRGGENLGGGQGSKKFKT